MTLKKKIGWTAGILLVLIVGICIGGSLSLIDFSLRPENRGKNMEESEAFMRTEYPQIVPWLDSLQQHHALRDTFITAPDGIRMHAFYARASRPTRRTAIIVHGYTDNAIRMFHIGYLYNQSLDYNILLPDLRYTGLTEGDAIQMGWLDRKDVLQWIDTAPALFGDSLKAVVHGISMVDSFEDAWKVISDYCKSKITDIAYNTWISRIQPVDLDFDNGTAYLLVPNDFHAQTLRRCYMSLLNEGFEEIFGTKFNIEFRTPANAPKKSKPSAAASITTSAATAPLLQSPDSSSYEYTFDTFIVGSSNKFAHAACLAVATNPSHAYNPLFLYGNSGLGKTHLLYAIGNEIKKNDPSKVICYIKGDDFTVELVESLRLAKMNEFRQKYRQADILLVDDVQFIGGKESTQEEFFHTFNALYDARKQIVLTSDRPPKEIKTLEDRLRSRFEQDLIADIQPPDLETRIAIIKRKAELDGVEISDEVCEYVASKIKANIRQLEGTVKKIKAKYYLDGEKPTINSVQGIISDILNNDAPPEVTVERIIDEVARTYGVSADEIRSQKNRSANISNARHIAIYVTRELTTLSMVAIGEEFGNRHYSTIIYTIQKVQKMMEKDRKVKEIIDDTIKNIRDR